jgi:signal transduction histidine kinase
MPELNARRPNEEASSLAPVAQRARETTAADAVILSARGTPGTRFLPVSAHGLSWDRVADVHGALARVNVALRRGDFVSITDLAADARTSTSIDWRAYGFECLLSFPLVWNDKVLGGIHALNPGTPIDIHDPTKVMQGLARHAAVVVANTTLSESAARPSQELQTVLALDEVILAVDSIEEMGEALLAKVAPLTGAATGGIMTWDEEHNVLRMLPGAFAVSEDDAVSCQVSTGHPTSNSARVFATGKSYMSNDVPRDPAHVQDYVDLFHLKRILTIPLSLGTRRIGVLHLANKPTSFTQSDLQTAEMLAPRIATVVELGRVVFRLRRHQRLTAALVDLAVGIASGGTMQDLAPRVLARIGQSTGVNALVLVFDHARPLVWHSDEHTQAVEGELIAEALEEKGFRADVVTPQGPGDPGRSTIHVPVRLEGMQIATLVAARNRAEPFANHERESFVRLANLAALAWATETNRQQRAELARLRERQRIADELHDTVAQTLFVAQINLESILESGEVEPATATKVSDSRALLLAGDTEIRNAIHELSRPVAGDLAYRLALLVEDLQDALAVSIGLEIPSTAAEVAANVRRPVADAMIKTAREAIVNAAKHAAPDAVSVRLAVARGDRLRLTITDDGTGITVGKHSPGKHHGLAAVRRAMREHGGLVRVGPGRSGGTKVTASIQV